MTSYLLLLFSTKTVSPLAILATDVIFNGFLLSRQPIYSSFSRTAAPAAEWYYGISKRASIGSAKNTGLR